MPRAEALDDIFLIRLLSRPLLIRILSREEKRGEGKAGAMRVAGFSSARPLESSRRDRSLVTSLPTN